MQILQISILFALVSAVSADWPSGWSCKVTDFYKNGVCQNGQGDGNACSTDFSCLLDDHPCDPSPNGYPSEDAKCN
ncbi:uncharacterized protein MYCGRDRAFT_83064, partial [Zymoseptoria tritici IPO323]